MLIHQLIIKLIQEIKLYEFIKFFNCIFKKKSIQIRNTYSKVGSEIFQLLGFEKSDSIQRMNHILQYETELANVSCKLKLSIENRYIQRILKN